MTKWFKKLHAKHPQIEQYIVFLIGLITGSLGRHFIAKIIENGWRALLYPLSIFFYVSLLLTTLYFLKFSKQAMSQIANNNKTEKIIQKNYELLWGKYKNELDYLSMEDSITFFNEIKQSSKNDSDV